MSAKFSATQCAVMRRGIEVLAGATTGYFCANGSGEHKSARALAKRHLLTETGLRTFRVTQRGAREFMDFLEGAK